MLAEVIQERLVLKTVEVMKKTTATDEEKVGADNSGGDGASDGEKVGGDNSEGDGAYNQGACNDEEEIGGHSCRDAFDFEENEEPCGAFIQCLVAASY